MRNFYFIIIIAGMLFSCKEHRQSKVRAFSKDSLYLHFQGGFNYDSVTVKINNIIVYEDILNTNKSIGYAGQYKCKLNEVKDNIKVIVKKDLDCHEITIKKNDLLLKPLNVSFLGVYFTEGKLIFYIKDGMPRYM